MKYFAQLDESNVVTEVLVISDEDAKNGVTFLTKELKLAGRWVETSIDNYAGIGFTYNDENGKFFPFFSAVSPQEFPA